MSIELITIIMFGSLIILLAMGMPVAFALGGCAAIFTWLMWGPQALYNMPTIAFRSMTNEILIAIPMFLLMAGVLQYTGIAGEAFDMIYKWAGGIRGGLAMGTILICTVFAAITGISGAATIAMAVIAIPAMRKYGYDKKLCAGCVAAGGVLGIVIPPSINMIIFATVARVSVGRLFFGGVIPGVIVALLHIILIGIRSYLSPQLAPLVPVEERASLKEKFISIKSMVLPLALVLLVLGTIYGGICTPTEASCIGVSGAFSIAIIQRKLNWLVLKEILLQNVTFCGMVFYIVIAATMFGNLYDAMGARTLMMDLVVRTEFNPWFVIGGMMFSIFLFGMIMDDYAIIMLCAPIYLPIIKALNFDPLWFGILFILNLQTAFLTPPFGYNLFFLRATVPEDFTMIDIYRGVYWFVPIQLLGMVLVMIFPQLAMWLPSQMLK